MKELYEYVCVVSIWICTFMVMGSDIVIETKDLTKYYGKTPGIEGVSLTVRKGEVYGFIGPNGAGKSTAIRTMLNLMFPTSGRAEIFGMETTGNHVRIMSRLGYLPGDVDYYSEMTAKELLRFSADFYGTGLNSRYHELTDLFQLDVDKPFGDLSMGNKKKVAIVQSVIHSPELIILDEPTNGLDPLMQSRFFELMEEEQRKGTTIFFSSHILRDVQRMCDRVSVIKEGKIIAEDTLEALIGEKLKVVKIKTDQTVSESSFTLKGISHLSIENDRISFNYEGDINELMVVLKELNILDITISEPTLEQMFMHFYE